MAICIHFSVGNDRFRKHQESLKQRTTTNVGANNTTKDNQPDITLLLGHKRFPFK